MGHHPPSLFSRTNTVALYVDVMRIDRWTFRLLAFLGIVLRWHYLEKDDVIQRQLEQTEENLSSNVLPKYEIVTTNYGWNTPAWSNFSRRIVTGEFFNATLSHDMYNSSAWAHLEQHPDSSRRVVAFMDIDTCLELNYPNYGVNWWSNVEKEYLVHEKFKDVVVKSCDYLKKAATSPALLANPDSRLVVLDCSGARRLYLMNVCGQDKSIFANDQVIIAYLSVKELDIRSSIDVGLPPPALKPIHLPAYERYQLQICQKRKYLFSFQGREVKGREGLRQLINYTDMYVRFHRQKDYLKDIQKNGAELDQNNYREIMQQSVFAGAPRGDNLFSYRFSEILSAGTVPVVYSDGWLPPFNKNIIDWKKCAVFIPESDYNKTRNILLEISEEDRCLMQKCALHVWDKYASSRVGWVRGLVEVALSHSVSHEKE